MPSLNVQTNVPLDGVVTSDILKDASKAVARILGKPESVCLLWGSVFCEILSSECVFCVVESFRVRELFAQSVNKKEFFLLFVTFSYHDDLSF